MDPIARNAAKVSGRDDGQPIVFAHGFGCDSNMWRWIAPRYEQQFKVVTFDYVGHGAASAVAFDPDRYSSLSGYAMDVTELCDGLELDDAIFVGHSVSSMIGAIACIERPELFAKLVMIGPSPRYIDDPDYTGGFGEQDIDEMLASLDSNYLGWSSTMAPVIMGNPDRPELGAELSASFCRTDPAVARQFARVTFLSDNRLDLAKVTTPTLVLQCRNDVIAPIAVGEYVRDHVPNATYRVLDATGHCPNLSAPDATAAAIDDFLGVSP
jgi:sigma-B regulation protein RsbQ